MNTSNFAIPIQLVPFLYKRVDGDLYVNILPDSSDSKDLCLEFDKGITYRVPVEKHPAPLGGVISFDDKGNLLQIKAERK